MFKIFDGNGDTLGLADAPNYIKVVDGVYVNCDYDEHDGIAFGGDYYAGGYAKEIDGAEYVFTRTEELAAIISDASDALIELAEIISE